MGRVSECYSYLATSRTHQNVGDWEGMSRCIWVVVKLKIWVKWWRRRVKVD